MSEVEPISKVSAQLRDIAAYLIEVSERSQAAEMTTHRSAIPLRKTAEASDQLALAWLAKEEIHERRRRTEQFDPDLFGEPAWDVLLDLFVARVAAKKISVTSACIAADVPPTTALRWLELLEKRGLLEREEDEFDRRRTWVRLSNRGFELLSTYLRRRASQREPQFIGIGQIRSIAD